METCDLKTGRCGKSCEQCETQSQPTRANENGRCAVRADVRPRSCPGGSGSMVWPGGHGCCRAKKPARAKRQDRGHSKDRQWYGGPDASFFAGKPFRFSGIRGVTGTYRGVRDRTKEQGRVEQRDAVAPGPPAKVSWAQWTRPAKPFEMQTRTAQDHPGCKGRTLREVEGLLE